tara:strand:- start:1218 stop:1724 length:507 start_codon:yes stop_codon:yes gene_type:complete
MGQEFTIKSENIESKINQLLPSQGGYGAGIDFTASTTVIPIVDLTETAEGSPLRQDLQTSISLNSATVYNISNTTTTLVNTTGYYRVFGNVRFTTTNASAAFALTDSITSKNIVVYGNNSLALFDDYDFIVFLKAGQSLTANTSNTSCFLRGVTRQVADVNGNLTNPS